MSINASRRNQAKLKKYVDAKRNTNPNRKPSNGSSASEAVRTRGRLGNQP